jgi:hypothetical protein
MNHVSGFNSRLVSQPEAIQKRVHGRSERGFQSSRQKSTVSRNHRFVIALLSLRGFAKPDCGSAPENKVSRARLQRKVEYFLQSGSTEQFLKLQPFSSDFAKITACGSPKIDRASPNCRSTMVMSKDSLEIENEGIVREINQHRMMLEVKPVAKGLKAPILRPSRLVIEPTRQLLSENLFT